MKIRLKYLPFLLIAFFTQQNTSYANDALFKAGYESFLNRSYSDAFTKLSQTKLPKQHPLIDYEYWALGKSALETANYPLAIQNFERLLAESPESLWANATQVGLGRALQANGENAKAEAFLQKNLQELPDDLRGEALYYLGLAEIAQNKKDSGLAHLRSSYIEYPDNAAESKILTSLQNLNALNFSSSELMQRAEKLFGAKKYSKALEAYESVLQSSNASSNSLARAKKGACLYFLKRYGDASIYLDNNNGLSPEVARSSLLYLGMSVFRQGDETKAIPILEQVQQKYPGTPEGEEALYRLGMIAHQASRFEEASRRFATLASSYSKGDFRDKGLWAGAWSAYRRSEWEEALKYLDWMEKGASDGPTQGKALYWQGRILQNQGKMDEAKSRWKRAAEVSPYSYYGAMALKNLNGQLDLAQTPATPSEWKISLTEPRAVTSKESTHGAWDYHYKKANALNGLGLGRLSFAELEAALKQNEGKPQALSQLLKAVEHSNHYYMKVWLGQRNWKNFEGLFASSKASEDFRTRLQYPYAYKALTEKSAAEFALTPELVVGLMRQESGFIPWISSSANAQGLMQLLPSTAAPRARALGLSSFDLFNPADNIRLGSHELSEMIKRFGGNWAYAIAAYNAGPGRSDQWSASFGNLKTDEFIEEIPYAETNLYVKLVLRNYWVYRMLGKS